MRYLYRCIATLGFFFPRAGFFFSLFSTCCYYRYVLVRVNANANVIVLFVRLLLSAPGAHRETSGVIRRAPRGHE